MNQTTEPSPPRVIAERLYDRTPVAQAYRRDRLAPAEIRRHLSEVAARAVMGADFAAVGLIEMTRMLECSDAERVAYVDRVLNVLAEFRGRAS